MQGLRNQLSIRRLAAAACVATAVLLPAEAGAGQQPANAGRPSANPGQSGAHQPVTANPGGSSTGGQPGATVTDPGVTSPTLPPQAPAVAGETVSVGADSGAVAVKLPGTAGFVPLDRAAGIPVGTVIDATHGVVTLTSVKDGGTTETGQFWGGEFRVDQTRSRHPVTVLTLMGGDFSSCRAPSRSRRVSVHSAVARQPTRRLWGRDHHGRFVTRGRSAVASVRGTVWLTKDGCHGTLVSVKRGAVVVKDLTRRRSVTLHAGRSYLAAPKL